MKILVSTMQNYTHQSGGIHVLHYFAYLAAKLGHDVLTSHETKPAWRGHVVECLSRCHHENVDFVLRPESDRRTSPNTIRWVLARPGWLPTGGPKSFADHEVAFWFSPDLEDPTREAAASVLGPLFLPSIDPEDWRIESPGPRRLAAYYVGKAILWSDCPWVSFVPQKSPIEITRSWPSSKRELSRVLHQCTDFYSFDDYSGILHEARMCGCRVWVWDKQKYEWKECQNDWSRYVMNEEADLRTVADALELMQQWEQRSRQWPL